MNKDFRIVSHNIKAFHDRMEPESNEGEAVASRILPLMNTLNSVRMSATLLNLNAGQTRPT